MKKIKNNQTNQGLPTRVQTPYRNSNQTWVLFHSNKTQMSELLRTILSNIGSTKKIEGTLDRQGIENVSDYIQQYSLKTSDLLNSDKQICQKEGTEIYINTFIDIIGKPQKSLLFPSMGLPSQKDWDIYENLVKSHQDSEVLVFHIIHPENCHHYSIEGITILKREGESIDKTYYSFNPQYKVPFKNGIPNFFDRKLSKRIPEYYQQVLYVNDMCEYMSFRSEKDFYSQCREELEKEPSLSQEWNMTISDIDSILETSNNFIGKYKSRMDSRVFKKVSTEEDMLEIVKIK